MTDVNVDSARDPGEPDATQYEAASGSGACGAVATQQPGAGEDTRAVGERSEDAGPVRVALAAVAGVLAVMAQYLLTTDDPEYTPVLAIAVALYAVAIASFLALASGWFPASDAERERTAERRILRARASGGNATVTGAIRRALAGIYEAALAAPLRTAGAVIALAIGLFVNAVLFARGDLGDNYMDLFAMWLLGMGLYLAAFVCPSSLGALRQGATWARNRREAILDASLLAAVAIMLRVPFVGSVPDVFGGDEALVGLVARGFIEDPGNMFSTAFAYSNVYHLAVTVPITLLGSTATAVRVLGALLASTAVPLSYLAGRELFGRRVGLAAGVLLLASHQHIHMSRTGHAHGVDAFIVAWVLFAFSRGFRRRHLGWMAVAGIALGAAQYVYVGARAIDVVVAVFVIGLAVVDWPRLRSSLSGVAVAFGGAVVTAGPMVVWALRRPGDYLTRTNQSGLFPSGAAEDRIAEGVSMGRLWVGQLYHGFMAPIAYPTENFYNARLPMVDLLWACLFVLGLALAVRRLRDWRYLLLLIAFLGTSLAILALGNLVETSSYRVTGALPVFALLAGVALIVLVERGLTGARLRGTWPAMAGAAVVAVIAGYNAGYYFFDYVPSCGYMKYDDTTTAVSLASMYTAEHASDAVVLAVTAPSFFIGSYPNGEYLTRRKMAVLGSPDDPQPHDQGAVDVIYELPNGSDLQAVLEVVGDKRPLLFWVSPFAEGNHRIADIEAALPGGQTETLSRCGEELMYLYYLPRRDALPD